MIGSRRSQRKLVRTSEAQQKHNGGKGSRQVACRAMVTWWRRREANAEPTRIGGRQETDSMGRRPDRSRYKSVKRKRLGNPPRSQAGQIMARERRKPDLSRAQQKHNGQP